ncbi:MAG: rhodanese-like domain-containing protein [Myxococcales bacterium]
MLVVTKGTSGAEHTDVALPAPSPVSSSAGLRLRPLGRAALPAPLASSVRRSRPRWWHPRLPDFSPPPAAADAADELDLATIRARFPAALWLDAREAEPFAAGHVPGALSLNETAWEAGFAAVVEAWDGERAIVVYCGGEIATPATRWRPACVANWVSAEIFVLRGGWPAWLAAGGETAR